MEINKRDIANEIANIVSSDRVVLFMKGSPRFPQCGFSASAVKMLMLAGVTQFKHINVLEDSLIREGIKEYSSWPTIPQLYVNQEFIGGADIMQELSHRNELRQIVETKSEQ